MNQEQLYLKNHTTHKDETCTVTLARICGIQWYYIVLFADCIAGGVHGEKIRKPTVWSLMEQPTQFRQHPSAPIRQLRGWISGVQQQGLAAFQQCWNFAETCFRKGAGSGVRKLSDYRVVRNFMLIAPSASGDWQSSSIFQSQVTVDSTFLSVALMLIWLMLIWLMLMLIWLMLIKT